MCDLWQSHILDSSSDGVKMDVLAAMNRVTLDIVGLAGMVPLDSLSFTRPAVTSPMNWSPDSDLVFVSF